MIFVRIWNSDTEIAPYICIINNMFHSNTFQIMKDSKKIELLNELVSKSTPQNVNFTPHNGNYCVTLVAVQPVDFFGNKKRNFKIKGRLDEGKTISADLIAEGEMLFGIEGLPYVAHEGDRTPIYKIVRASILCAYGALQLPYLHRSMRNIARQDYPFTKKDNKEQLKAEIRFMKKLAAVNGDSGRHTKARTALIHSTSSRLKDCLLYYKEYEPRIYEQIQNSMTELQPFIPSKEDSESAVPDMFVWKYDSDYPSETFDHQVVMFNAKSKNKGQFWWDYLKLNIFLEDPEYRLGYYILMNRWQIPVIQRWIAEYREKALFESQCARDYLLFYLKAGEKTPVRVLNSQGVQVKVKMIPR